MGCIQPTTRDRRLPALADGLGDRVAGTLAITPRRLANMAGPIRFDLTSPGYQLYLKSFDSFLN